MDTRRITGAETAGMRALRNGLRDSGTGENKLAGLDAEIRKRVESGSDITPPSTSEEWQAYAQGATRAADFLAANADVTRAKAHGISSGIVRQARERRAAALASEDALALVGRPAGFQAAAGGADVVGRIGGESRVPKGIVKRLGPDPNLTGTGVLYRWCGNGEAMEISPSGADVIELVSGDCQLIENRLVPLPGVEAVFRVIRRGVESQVRWEAAPPEPAPPEPAATGGRGAAGVGGKASGGSDGGGGPGVAHGGPTAATDEGGGGGSALEEAAAPKEAWELTDAELDRLTQPGGVVSGGVGSDQGGQVPPAEDAGA